MTAKCTMRQVNDASVLGIAVYECSECGRASVCMRIGPSYCQHCGAEVERLLPFGGNPDYDYCQRCGARKVGK